MNKSFSKIRHIQESNQRLEKRFINESFWDLNFGKPTVDDASRTQLKGKGYSFRGKDDEEREGEDYIVHDGQKYFSDDIIYADYQDLGDLPRVEDGKLIIANPAWSL